ncbi:MAG: hypothetical protein ACI4PF_01895 [Christensenellales bacterium]
MKFIFFVFLVTSMFFSGCTSSMEKLVKSNISEFREFVVYGKDNDISVSLMCGVRENEYKINGYATELIEFGVITVNLKEDLNKDNAIYVLFVGTKKYEGDLTINPFDNTLVADIKKIVDKNANISIIIRFEEREIPLKLQNVDTDWAISSDDCIKILVKKYSDKLKTFVNNRVFEAEVYVKIMNDEKDLVQDFYFLASVYGRNGKSINIILSPLTGEILASNTNI